MYLLQINSSNTYAAADDYIARPLASDLTFTVLVDDVIYLSLVFRLPWGGFIYTFSPSFSISFTIQSSNQLLALLVNLIATYLNEFHQFNCYYAVKESRLEQKMPLVLSINTPYPNIMKWYKNQKFSRISKFYLNKSSHYSLELIDQKVTTRCK